MCEQIPKADTEWDNHESNCYLSFCAPKPCAFNHMIIFLGPSNLSTFQSLCLHGTDPFEFPIFSTTQRVNQVNKNQVNK